MNVDFHCHFYPEEYLNKLEASRGDVRIERDDKGRPFILSMGAKAGPVTADYFDIELRVDKIKQHDIDMQILTTPHPGIDRFSAANDGLLTVRAGRSPLSGPFMASHSHLVTTLPGT